jgi:hypothetical protein
MTMPRGSIHNEGRCLGEPGTVTAEVQQMPALVLPPRGDDDRLTKGDTMSGRGAPGCM